MTTLDRAFIKAFAITPPVAPPAEKQADAPHSQPAVEPTPGATDEALAPAAALEELSSTLPASSFARPEADESFRPLLEIDRATWPLAVNELLERAGRDWDRFAAQLIERMGQGQKCVAVASLARGDGRTTISLALAKHLAARGLRPVVVDADPENPTLARSCGISLNTGWDDLLSGELSLGEALITAVEDGITLMPWRGAAASPAQLAAAPRAADIFNTLREHHDLVLLDSMPLVGQTTIADFANLAEAIRLDALYLIHNVSTASAEELAATSSELRRAGLPLVAVIENFVSPDGPGNASAESSAAAGIPAVFGIRRSD